MMHGRVRGSFHKEVDGARHARMIVQGEYEAWGSSETSSRWVYPSSIDSPASNAVVQRELML
jgi:hypothetical protein